MTEFKEWQVAEARHRFGDLLEAAWTGFPQKIRHRNGQEFVLMSRESYDALRRDLSVVLTAFDFGVVEDEFDHALGELRPDNIADQNIVQGIRRNVPRHRRRKRGAEAEAKS